ncbi:Spo11/DNA topoisomerase VI subunit A [Spinellus fusiger]|nr:Spo11/DNA topoisomerase VI subunit A [Spinellus fusiger]
MDSFYFPSYEKCNPSEKICESYAVDDGIEDKLCPSLDRSSSCLTVDTSISQSTLYSGSEKEYLPRFDYNDDSFSVYCDSAEDNASSQLLYECQATSSASDSINPILDHYQHDYTGYEPYSLPFFSSLQVVPTGITSSEKESNVVSCELSQTSTESQSSSRTSKKRSLFDMEEDTATQSSVLSLETPHNLSKTKQDKAPRRITPSTIPTSKLFARQLRLLEIIYAAIASDTVVTKRDIYYRDVSLFGTQTVVNKSAASKGLVSGPIKISLKSGKRINCQALIKKTEQHNDELGCLIPPINQVKQVDTEAKCVIVVEKEATFRDLVSAKSNYDYLKTCILITGRGYPDLATRHMLRYISTKYKDMPILALVDSDPYGLEIFSVYKWGSWGQAYDTANLAVPGLQLLGLTYKDKERKAVELMPIR